MRICHHWGPGQFEASPGVQGNGQRSEGQGGVEIVVGTVVADKLADRGQGVQIGHGDRDLQVTGAVGRQMDSLLNLIADKTPAVDGQIVADTTGVKTYRIGVVYLEGEDQRAFQQRCVGDGQALEGRPGPLDQAGKAGTTGQYRRRRDNGYQGF